MPGILDFSLGSSSFSVSAGGVFSSIDCLFLVLNLETAIKKAVPTSETAVNLQEDINDQV
jgi:hypothetical protein